MKIIRALIMLVFVSVAASACSTNDVKQTEAKQTTGKEIIVDVRTPEEWNTDGHAACTVNYPLQDLEAKLPGLKEYSKVTFVCRSGHRAGLAKEMLEGTGYKNAVNGGTWKDVQCK